MKILIAIMTCHAYRHRAEAQRETWVKDIPASADYKFFLGQQDGYQPQADEVMVEAPDDYRNFPRKVQAMLRWAHDQGYDYVFKCDDDVYVQPNRLLMSQFERGDYVGRKRGPSGGFSAPYASGFSYWLSRKAISIIIKSPITTDPAEDRWIGNLLLHHSILCHADYRYVVTQSTRNALSYNEGPRCGNDIISACEFEPDRMRDMHWQWENKKALILHRPQFGAHILCSVSVLVKTFLRDGYLLRTVKSISEFLPESKIVIVDDGYETSHKISWYASLRQAGHDCEWLPFDSGFGAKANAGVEKCDRKYVLIASDDFQFTQETRRHVTRMAQLLHAVPSLDVVSGRVNNNPYEAVLMDEGEEVKEVPGYWGEAKAEGIEYKLCDLTVNFSLIRREVFENLRWDDDVKIGGGEHGAFFLDLKRLGGKVAYLPEANINEMPRNNSDWQDPMYSRMRNRARQPGRPCLVRRGVKRWILQDGSVEETGL
jgi:hypothetical protein